jgi:hypothetical protein
MKSLFAAALVAGGMLAGTISTASAAVVAADWLVAGDGLIVRDTDTSLDWMSLTATNGLSFNYVNSQLGSSGAFSGFRFASGAEVVDFFERNFSLDLSESASHPISGVADSGIIQASLAMGNIANEWNSAFPYGFAGMISESHASPYEMVQYIGAMDAIDLYGYSIYWDAVEHGHLVNQQSSYIGSYLVRVTPVPLPAGVWLLLSALGGLGFAGWRRKAVTA